jgi:hypothetical protein
MIKNLRFNLNFCIFMSPFIIRDILESIQLKIGAISKL